MAQKFLRRFIIGLLSLIVLLIVVAYALPGNTVVTRSIDIKAPAEKVYKQYADFNNWPNWSPWYAKDKSMQQTITESAGMARHTMKWSSDIDEVGHGSLTFDKVVENNSIDATLMLDDMKMESTLMFKIEPTASGCKVSWSDSASLGYNPMMRWMGLFMDKFMGPDFEAGLKNLKAVSEKE